MPTSYLINLLCYVFSYCHFCSPSFSTLITLTIHTHGTRRAQSQVGSVCTYYYIANKSVFFGVAEAFVFFISSVDSA